MISNLCNSIYPPLDPLQGGEAASNNIEFDSEIKYEKDSKKS